MSFDPYKPPVLAKPAFDAATPAPMPGVFIWYAVYCTVLALVYVACIAGGLLLIVFASQLPAEDVDSVEAFVMGLVLVVISIPLALLFLAGPFLPRSKLGWIVGIVNIGIGMTSGCTLLPCIFLLIFWLKPETKQYYGIRG